ncbi:uncharacterized protein V1516DRAFT_667933 [Lipomyces oligophaga]|uniref:uncharacterized protein n=1 Tax=Lipomyces oligophaga TaxID=45792 RepID=UPI0034CD4FBC
MWFFPVGYVLKLLELKEKLFRLENLRPSTAIKIQKKIRLKIRYKLEIWTEKFLIAMVSGLKYRLLLPILIPYTALKTQAFKYPLYGFIYFVFHPILWPSLIKVVTPLILLLVGVTVGWFTIGYPPQMIIMIFLNGPFGMVSAFVLVLHQTLYLYNLLAKVLFIKGAHKELFDTVLRMRGLDKLLDDAPLPYPEILDRDAVGRVYDETRFKLQMQWRIIARRLTAPSVIVKEGLRFPIQFIPVVGPYLVAIIGSVDYARNSLRRYYQLKGWNEHQIHLYGRKRVGGFLAFGLLAAPLEEIPLLGLAFSFSNVTGAALWAADIEHKEFS